MKNFIEYLLYIIVSAYNDLNIKSKRYFTKQSFKQNKFDNCGDLFDFVYIFILFIASWLVFEIFY